MILVMGATGHIGSKIISHLLERQEEVRGVARHFPNPEKFHGAELLRGDANDVSFLTTAMRGCSAVFTMIPPNPPAKNVRYYQNKFGEVTAEAIEEAGVRKVVNLSSVGAELDHGTGPILGLHDQEERMNEITHADIVHLRPTYFMENFISSIPTIFANKRIFGTVPGDLPISMIATKDIALRCTELLLHPDFRSHTVEYLLGERDLSMEEAARILAAVLQMPGLEYNQVSPEEMKQALMAASWSEDWADAYNEMSAGFASGAIGRTLNRDSLTTTPTSFEEFARTTFLEASVKASRKKMPSSELPREQRL